MVIDAFLRNLIKPFSVVKTLKRLGYPPETKLLIVHADDMGLSHSTNLACEKAMENGSITSGSVMIPCPFAYEAIEFSKRNFTSDLGIHLTLTSEWKGHQWRPILGESVPSLTDSNGFFFETREELESNAKLSEVEHELCAQIESAMAKGMNPTHMDCHMFAGILNPEFLEIYIRLGRSFGLPVLLNREKIKKWFLYDVRDFITNIEIPVDKLYIATPRLARKGLAYYYRDVLHTLRPGLNCLLVHPALDDEEMKMLTKGHTDYNSVWRQADYDFFTSEECLELIVKNNIQLTTWKEIKERLQPYG